MRLDEAEEQREYCEARNRDRRGDAPTRRSAKTPRAEHAGYRKKDRLIFLDCQSQRRGDERPNDRAGVKRKERPRDGRRSKPVFVEIAEDQAG